VRSNVAIIVLNWNGWTDTLECLESLQHLTYPSFQIILVDNGSIDDSVTKIKDWCGGKIPVQTDFVRWEPDLKPVAFAEYGQEDAESGGDIGRDALLKTSSSQRRLIIIQTAENLGFAGGNNVALKYCLKRDYDYLLLLNNDTVVDPEFLTELIKVAASDEAIGIAGPMVLYYHRPRCIFSAGISMSNVGRRVKRIGLMQNQDVLPFNKTKDVEGVAGCALLIGQKTVRTIGLLDERYFLYMEEADWCTRAIRHHFRCVYIPKAKIWHKGWGSVPNDPGLLDYYLARSQILYLKKYSFGVRFILDVVAYSLRSFFKTFEKSAGTGHWVVWRAHLLGLVHGFSGRYSYRWNRPARSGFGPDKTSMHAKNPKETVE
jgi:GT2 family glycosyltransferase